MPASSARRRIRAAGRRPAPPTARQAGIVRDFEQAWQAQGIGALIGLLDPDATVTADGGGRTQASPRPVEGGERIAHHPSDLFARASGALTVVERTVNGRPGLVALQDGRTVAVYAFDIAGDRTTRIRAVLNAEKLRPWTRG